jgi:hypothetical protein
MAAGTSQSTLFTDPNALGQLNGPTSGPGYLYGEHTFALTELDDINDRVQLAPLRARGGRNRFIGIGLTWADVEGAAGTLRAKLVINMKGADTEVLAASDIFNTVSVAGVLYWILNPILLDDVGSAYNGIATLDFVVTAAAGNGITAKLKFIILYE